MKNKIKGSLSPLKINKGLGLLILLSVFVLIISLSLAISVGAVQISTSTVWGVIINKLYPETFETIWSKGREAIVWNVRFPRSLLAIIVGSGLAIVGASLQAVTRNPLADPHLLGISSGGAFGAILALLHTGLFIGLLTVPLMALFGGFSGNLYCIGSVSFDSCNKC